MTMDTGQVTLNASTPTLIVTAKPRNVVTINLVSGGDVFLGGPSVTTATGTLLTGSKGTPFTWTASDALYGITSTGASVVSYAESY